MSVKNFKITTGLDLDGLVLNIGASNVLYWNSEALATQAYVTNALGNVNVDPSGWTGSYLDWNLGDTQYDVDIALLATDLENTYSHATTTYVTNNFVSQTNLNSDVDALGYLKTADQYIQSIGSGFGLAAGNLTLDLDTGLHINPNNSKLSIDDTYYYTKTAANNEIDSRIGTALTNYATDSDVTTAINNLIGAAPGALDTLQELASAIGDDASFSTTITNLVGGKQDSFTLGTGLTYETSNPDTIGVDSNVFATVTSLSDYLTTIDASNTYLAQSTASSTYLTQNNASSTYLTQSNASSTYLTQNSAANTYLTQNSASSLYATQSSLMDYTTTANLENTIDNYGFAYTSEIPTSTDGLIEGGLNKYYSDTLVDNHLTGGNGISYIGGVIEADVAGGLHIDGAQIKIDRMTVDTWYDASGAASTVAGTLTTHMLDTSTHGVTGDIVGTTDTQNLSNKTIIDSLHFKDGSNNYSAIHPNINSLNIDGSENIVLTTNTGDIVLDADGQSYIGSASAGNEIATHSYVDNAVSGLGWKQSVHLFADTDVDIYSSWPSSIDGHSSPSSPYRVLLTNQSTDADNGIWVYDNINYTWSRATDADTFGELIGAAVFVMEGTTYGGSSWVQTNHYLTDFNNQDWSQFSGNGTVTAGSGITVNGLEVSVNRTTVDGWYDASGAATTVQSNLTTHAGYSTGVHGVTGNIVGTTDSQTLTNKTLTDPTINVTGLGSVPLEYLTAITSDVQVQLNAKAGNITGVSNEIETTTSPEGDVTIGLPDSPAIATSLIIGLNQGIHTDGSLTVTKSDATNAFSVNASQSKTTVYGELRTENPTAFHGSAHAVLGNAMDATFVMGSNQTIDVMPLNTEVADVLLYLRSGSETRVSKLTAVFTGSEAPTWTEYGIITSGWSAATTVSFDSSQNIIVNVAGSSTYAARCVVTTL